MAGLFKKLYLPLFLLCFAVGTEAIENRGDKYMRYFMFVGQPNAKAWKWLIENPQDRQAKTEKSIESLGGKMLSYYFGLGNGRNYITVAMPNDTELIQAAYVLRLASDLLVDYQVIELISSQDMLGVLRRVEDVMAVDDIQKKTNGS